MVSRGRSEPVRSHLRSGIGAVYVEYGGTSQGTETGSRQVNMCRWSGNGNGCGPGAGIEATSAVAHHGNVMLSPGGALDRRNRWL
jgi:hypothetical protein